jgi:hypothetical protein
MAPDLIQKEIIAEGGIRRPPQAGMALTTISRKKIFAWRGY